MFNTFLLSTILTPLVILCVISNCRADPPEVNTMDVGNGFCSRVGDFIGPGEGVVVECTVLLPDLYSLRLNTEEGIRLKTVVTEGSVPVRSTGLAPGASWLRRIRVYELSIPSQAMGYLALALEALEAIPSRFTAADFSTEETERLRASEDQTPFLLVFQRTDRAPRNDEIEGIEDLVEPVGGPSPSLNAGPPETRAILRGDAQYRFTWTIDRRDFPGAEWFQLETLPCE